ncbi:hypothetical protein [Tenacibaculum crassostreae]
MNSLIFNVFFSIFLNDCQWLRYGRFKELISSNTETGSVHVVKLVF